MNISCYQFPVERPANQPRVFKTKSLSFTYNAPQNRAQQSSSLLCSSLHFPAPQLNKIFSKHRELLIELIENTCREIDVCNNVKHLAISIFDKSNIFKKFSKDTYEVLALVSIGLAVKYEYDNCTLNLRDLAMFSKSFSENQLRLLEIEVLTLLNWQIDRKNAVFYIDSYFENGNPFRKILNRDSNVEKLYNFSLTFADLSARISDLVLVDPRIIACSCVAFARKKLRFESIWPQALSSLTGLNEDSLKVQNIEEKFNLLLYNS